MLRSRRHSWAAASAATLGSMLALPPSRPVRRMMQNSNKAPPLLRGGPLLSKSAEAKNCLCPQTPAYVIAVSGVSACAAAQHAWEGWTVGRDSSQHVSATQCRACPLLCSLHRCMCPSCVLQQTSQHAQHAACLATRRPACRTPKDKIANALLHVPLMCPAANIKCITFHACALHMPCSKHSSMHSMRPA